MTPNDHAFSPHAHDHCVESALAQADELCRQRGVRLTELRRRVLELVWQSHKPMGAYALLDALAENGPRPAPPTVYRALEFLIEQRLVHRIASLNAYVGCSDPEHRHSAYFLICRSCGNVSELSTSPALQEVIQAEAERQHFNIESQALEVVGLCQSCQ